MNARKVTAALVFLVALSLSFGYLRAQATGSCSRTVYRIPVTANTEFLPVFCSAFQDFTWTIGSDLCNTSPYERCARLSSCNVLKSDFLQRDRTFVCCNNGTTCYEFTIDPVVNDVNLPPVMEAGKEATVYTTFAAKPLPSDLPSLNVSVIQGNETRRIDTFVRNRTIPNPANTTEYIILHTFVVPLEFEGVAFSYSLPPSWSSDSSVDLTLGPIGIVLLDDEPTSPSTDAGDTRTTTDPATDPGATTTDISPTSTVANTAATSTSTALDKTASVVDPTATNVMTVGDGTGSTTGLPTDGLSPRTSACIDSGHVAAAVVGGIVFTTIIFVIFVCVIFWCNSRKRKNFCYSEKTNSIPQPPYGAPLRPNNVPLIAHTLNTQDSITPTPLYGGETPSSETAGLLRSYSGNHGAVAAGNGPPFLGATNIGYNRIPSHDSTSPTTPGEGRQPLSAMNPGYSPRGSSLSSPRTVGPNLDRISSRESNSPTTPYTPGDTVRPLLRRSSGDEPSAAAAASTDKRTDASGTSVPGNHGAAAGPNLDRISSRESNSPTTPYTSGDTVRPVLRRSSGDEPSAAATASTDKRTDASGTSVPGPNSGTASAGSSDGSAQHVTSSNQEQTPHIYEEIKKPGYLPPSQRPLPNIPNVQQEEYSMHNSSVNHDCNGFHNRKDQLFISKNLHKFITKDSLPRFPPPIIESKADADDADIPAYQGVHDGSIMNLPLQGATASIEVSFV